MNKQVSTYIIQWYDNEGTWHMDYIQALSPEQAIDILGVDLDSIADVSKVLKKYERKVY